MNHETARSLFMDYIYEEMDDKQRREFEKYVSQHPDLQEELSELGDTRSILSFLPVEEPTEKLVIVPPTIVNTPEQPVAKIWQLTKFTRYAAAAAACLLMVFVGAALSKTNFSYDENGFQVAFGVEPAPIQQGYSPEQVQLIVDHTIEKMRDENIQFVTDFVNAARTQQRDEFEQTLLDFANLFNDQRNQDLKFIADGMNQIQQNTFNRFRQTDLVLDEIIETVGSDKP